MSYLYNFHYSDHLRRLLADFEGIKVEVDEEQAFLKHNDLDPDTIYVIIKNLTPDIEDGAITQPIQILILSEQNSLDNAKSIFTQIAMNNNWVSYTESYIDENNNSQTRLIKQQFTQPVVASNFNSVTYGYRTVLYMSVNLAILERILFVKDLKIDSNTGIKALSFNISYSMQTNTQQIDSTSEFIAKSTKNVSSLAITMSTPFLDNDFCNKILGIINEEDVQTTSTGAILYGGNENFLFDFYIGTHHFENKPLKLISYSFSENINDVPTITLGFMK